MKDSLWVTHEIRGKISKAREGQLGNMVEQFALELLQLQCTAACNRQFEQYSACAQHMHSPLCAVNSSNGTRPSISFTARAAIEKINWQIAPHAAPLAHTCLHAYPHVQHWPSRRCIRLACIECHMACHTR